VKNIDDKKAMTQAQLVHKDKKMYSTCNVKSNAHASQKSLHEYVKYGILHVNLDYAQYGI
jgi:hypothetical protein